MPPKTKQTAEIAARRQATANYYLKRIDQNEIVELLKKDGIETSQPTVSRDINFLINQWKKNTGSIIEDLIAREEAELNIMEMEATGNYYDAKGRSRLDDEENELPYNQNGVPSNQKLMEIWMLVRLKIKERRAKMLKLDGPQKIELDANLKHSGKIDVSTMTEEELQQSINDNLKKLADAGYIQGT